MNEDTASTTTTQNVAIAKTPLFFVRRRKYKKYTEGSEKHQESNAYVMCVETGALGRFRNGVFEACGDKKTKT